MLEFPSYILRGNILLIGCEEKGVYNPLKSHCEYCPDSQSCQWLQDVDTASGYSQFNYDELVEHLEFAMDKMIVQARMLEHNIFTCICEMCKWIQDALQLYEKTFTRQ